METPLLLTYPGENKNDDVFISPKPPSDHQSDDSPSFTDPGEFLCLVPIRWWEEAECGEEVGKGVLYKLESESVVVYEDVMNIDGFEETMSRELSVGLRKSDEEEVCCDGALALVSEWMFCSALKWYYDKKGGNLGGKSTHDIISLRIRVSYGAETNTLAVKIGGKENESGAFERVLKLFCSNFETLQIWDFSGQTDQLFLDDMKQFKESDQSYEITKELCIYGLSCPVEEEGSGKEGMFVEQDSMVDDLASNSSTTSDGCMDQVNCLSPTIGCMEKVNLPSASDGGCSGTCPVKEEEKLKDDMVVEQSVDDDPTSSSSTMAIIGCMEKVNSPSASFGVCSGTFPVKEEERVKEDMVVEQSVADDPTSSSSTMAIIGCIEKVNLPSASDSELAFSLGLTGLRNLGNTCFMSSAIQCLVHTRKLDDYFLGNFRRDLNFENPLGMNGKLAIVFGHLLRRLWVTKSAAIRPNLFKATISNLTTLFAGGYVQHDSQEFLAFMLNGLHEDLNRVKSKPYFQAKDEDGRPHEEVADEYWENDLSRNDSIIIDLCQGQERSTLTCPDCRNSSVKFETFMYLTLEIPSTTLRKMTLTVLSHGVATLDQITVMVPKNGTYENLQEVAAEACSLREDETLRIADIYNREIHRFLDNPCDLVKNIRDSDCLVAYKLPKDESGSPLVAFYHVRDFPPCGFPRYFSGHPMDMQYMHKRRNRICHCSPNGFPENGGTSTDVAMHHQDKSHEQYCPLYMCPEDGGGSTADAVMHHRGINRRTGRSIENNVRHQKRNCRNPYQQYGPEYEHMDMRMQHHYYMEMRMQQHPYMDMRMQHGMMGYNNMHPFAMRPPKFGIPLLIRMSDFSNGSTIRKAFLELINPFLLPNGKSSHDSVETEPITVPQEEDAEMKNEPEKDLDDTDDDFEFELGTNHWSKCEIEMDKPVPVVIEGDKPIKVVVNWPEKIYKECDTLFLSKLPSVSAFKEDSVSLNKCMEAYLKEEPLGPDDMWYCPHCKEHKQAIKKLDLWRLPEILVINLKRFSYDASFQSTKLETPVDFPIDNFDISDFINLKKGNVSHCYALYAVTNHYGGSGGGHYTAFVKKEDSWYEFDDNRVTPVAEKQIKTPAAYVLFYRRV